MTVEVMGSALFSVRDRLAANVDLSPDLAFGREGWTRSFPQRFDFQ